ncbi:hypothetical protein GFL72_19575 [Rhizobium leguminosarum bv. viciae]|uniref:DUF3800 domain-containing protein n=1 Tax=Rhizobium leguminosarum TaxID=384 RepID=UPI0014416213|nr:DUF3800 domain-containing protein [Rhizobium leguminosarum]NKK36821.1 hypothetical protein [Rhizobium leguminosarum bv. viciae]
MDINNNRDADIRFHNLTAVDRVYTMFYDETNNVRKLHLTPDGLNVDAPACFVLGGIAHAGQDREIDISALRARLQIQASTKEIKLEHIGKGDFPSLLNSAKMKGILEWIGEQGLHVHFQVVDLIYWSIVDIVDSILAEVAEAPLMAIGAELKDDLYRVLRSNLPATVVLLRHYNYPNVGRDRTAEFVATLLEMVEGTQGLLHDFNYQMLRGVLQMALRFESLVFLDGEKPNVLIEDFSTFYIKRICLFKHARHVLDAEPRVRDQVERHQITDNGKPFVNYEFVDSVDCPGVQISDVVAGLLGKAFTFLNRNSMGNLHAAKQSLSIRQQGCLQLLVDLLDRSIAENVAFANFVVSHEDRRRAAYLLDL